MVLLTAKEKQPTGASYKHSPMFAHSSWISLASFFILNKYKVLGFFVFFFDLDILCPHLILLDFKALNSFMCLQSSYFLKLVTLVSLKPHPSTKGFGVPLCKWKQCFKVWHAEWKPEPSVSTFYTSLYLYPVHIPQPSNRVSLLSHVQRPCHSSLSVVLVQSAIPNRILFPCLSRHPAVFIWGSIPPALKLAKKNS